VGETKPHYEAAAGIRPPYKRTGRVRGVAYEMGPGGGVELWHCEHDHAPGVRVMPSILPGQRETAEECAEEWLTGQIRDGHLPPLPIQRGE
jgi:hypothetical protein